MKGGQIESVETKKGSNNDDQTRPVPVAGMPGFCSHPGACGGYTLAIKIPGHL
jgi:hypothetical protein